MRVRATAAGVWPKGGRGMTGTRRCDAAGWHHRSGWLQWMVAAARDPASAAPFWHESASDPRRPVWPRPPPPPKPACRSTPSLPRRDHALCCLCCSLLLGGVGRCCLSRVAGLLTGARRAPEPATSGLAVPPPGYTNRSCHLLEEGWPTMAGGRGWERHPAHADRLPCGHRSGRANPAEAPVLMRSPGQLM